MSLDQSIHLTIRVQDVPPPMPGFGTPCLIAYHPLTGARMRSFASLEEAETAGIVSTSKTTRYPHAMLAAAFAQDPRPEVVKLFRRGAAPTQTTVVTIGSGNAEGVTFDVKLFGTVVGSYKVGAGKTPTQIASAIVALITAGVTTEYGVTADNGGGSPTPAITFTGASGCCFMLEIAGEELDFTVSDTTSDTTTDDDLAAAIALDPDFYGFEIDVHSKAAIEAAAAANTARRMFVTTSADSALLDPESTTDVGAEMSASNTARVNVVYHHVIGSALGFARMADRFTVDPGTDSWAYKDLVGFAASDLSTDAQAALRAKNVDMLVELVAGDPVLLWGKMSDGSYADIVRGVDALYADIQRGQYGVFRANEKVPYEESGADLFEAALADSLRRFESSEGRPGLIAAGGWSITRPKVSAQNPTDRANRVFRGLRFKARASGAVHELYITGDVTF